MNSLLPLIFCGLYVIILVGTLPFWLRARNALDKLIKYELENLPEQREKDRQPRFFTDSSIAAIKFILTTPDWVKNNPEPKAHLKDFRKFTLFWSIGVLASFLVVFSIQIYRLY